MKIILVDVGSFYTKVSVMRRVAETDGGDRSDQGYQFYGRSFFPTLVRRVDAIDKGLKYYEHEGDLYAVGYDCGSGLIIEQIGSAFDDEGFNFCKALIILKRVIFDYADSNDDLEINVVVDSDERARVFKEIGKALHNNKIEISAVRGYDERRIKKEVKISFRLLSSGDAVVGFLEKNGMDFTTALVIDVGHNKTKLYVVNRENGVELFQIERCGVSFYYEKIVRLIAEENIHDNHYLWLVKQIELGCDEIEVRREREHETAGGVAALPTRTPRSFDVSLIMQNVRWDLNKDFNRFTTEMLTSYYTNRVEWPALLVVTGGGASLNGDILRSSLEEGGYDFNDVYIDRQPMYTVVDGAAYALGVGQA